MSRKQRRANIQAQRCEELLRQPEERLNSEAEQPPLVSDIDCAFPTRWRELLPPWGDLTEAEKRGNGPYCDALQSLFFRGGRLSDHGIVPKPGVELKRVMRYIQATLGDFGPKHEHKIGGIAHMLAKWCDVQAASLAAEKERA